MQMNEAHNHDQAAGLRHMVNAKPAKVIAVTAGKGGVGKSNVSVNLAIALAKQKQQVLLLDADLGLANIDVLLGLHPDRNLSHVIEGQCSLQDIIIKGPAGVQIIPSSSGTDLMTRLNSAEHSGVINAFNTLTCATDILIIDTAAGISETVTTFTRSSEEVIVVVCDEPTSITDAYALIKILSKQHQISRFRVLANMVQNAQEGVTLFNKLNRATEKYLDVVIDYMGAIPFDNCLRQAVKKQQAVINAYPSSQSACEFKKVAKKILKWSVKSELSGHDQFFMNRLVQGSVCP